MTGFRTIEITFAEPVEISNDHQRHLVELIGEICNAYEATHPGRVMWPFGIGFKPTYIPMTREEEETRGMEFADDIFAIKCAERADYKAKCARCGLEQGDHRDHIVDPPAGDCEFTIANG